jgi:putative ABC transport system permease protein
MKRTNNHPPKAASRLLAWFAGKADLEDIQGDMDEMYGQIKAANGSRAAKLYYWRQVISLIFSYALTRRKSHQALPDYYGSNRLSMIQNYFKVAVRNMAKQRLFTAINVLGLAMGMSASLLILAVIIQVLSFDDFHEKKDRIVRITTDVTDEDGNRVFATTTDAIYDQLSGNVIGIEAVTRLNYGLDYTVFHHDNEIEISGIYTDPTYFDLFSFDLKYGNKATALTKPYNIILSAKLANKLFPDIDPVGKTIQTIDKTTLTISGVLAAHPRQTHLHFDVLGSYSSIENTSYGRRSVKEKWNDYNSAYQYLLLNKNTDQENLIASFSTFSDQAKEIMPDKEVSFGLQAFTDISPGKNLFRDNTHFDWVGGLMLFFMGFLILIPAVFNYTNLMIARSLKRAKEIGIRKVVGSSRSQIGYQFIVEAVLLSSVALIGTIIIFTIIRTEFLTLIIGSKSLDLSLSPLMLFCFSIFGLLTGVFAGIFPAIYFSKLAPLQSLRNAVSSSSVSISGLRKALIVGQFSISLIFIIGIAVIVKQHKDMLNYNIGFKKDNIIVVPLKGMDPDLLVNELSSIPGIAGVTSASIMPGVEAGLGTTHIRQIDNYEDSMRLDQIFVDEQFISLLGFHVIWGENLTENNNPEIEKVLVNREFMKRNRILNQTEDSLIQYIDGTQKSMIVGVIEDFNFMQLNMGMSPLVVRYIDDNARFALVKTKPTADLIATLNQMEEKWAAIDDQSSFDSYFLDHRIEESYKSTLGTLKIFSFFGTLSICISCIGLLGMVVYFTENRMKEVAIRKIMGASILNLYQVLGGSFLKLLLIAVAIATPLAYFFYEILFVPLINKHSTGVGFMEMFGSVVFMLVLGLLPILWIVSRVANLNPADNLRSE